VLVSKNQIHADAALPAKSSILKKNHIAEKDIIEQPKDPLKL